MRKIKGEKWKERVGNGSCLCSDLKIGKFRFDIHCWRTGLCCTYSGIHIVSYPKGKLAEAKEKAAEVAAYIEESWGTNVTIATKSRS